MNNDNNNFSLIRNSEINRIGPKYISPQFYKMYSVNDKMKQLSAYEDEHYINNHSKIWTRENYTHKYCNDIINKDYDKQYCIINDNIDNEELVELYKNPRNDFLFLSNKLSHDDIFAKLNEKGFDRMKCFSMLDASDKELDKYFKLLYANSNCQYEILDNKSNTIEALCINIIKNIPNIRDVNTLIGIIDEMGVSVTKLNDSDYKFQANDINLEYLHSKEFVNKTPLENLSKREALRLMN